MLRRFLRRIRLIHELNLDPFTPSFLLGILLELGGVCPRFSIGLGLVSFEVYHTSYGSWNERPWGEFEVSIRTIIGTLGIEIVTGYYPDEGDWRNNHQIGEDASQEQPTADDCPTGWVSPVQRGDNDLPRDREAGRQ